ncbi:MAG: GntR family transcriptional regulator [Paracoccaceae bacterium]
MISDTATATDLRIDRQTTTLRGLAVERLRQAIITGHFSGGERLVERALCDQLGVSRSVVREAIRYLEAEGLVEIEPRSGPIVATLDWPRARQIYDIRRLLEAEAAADCARRADPVVETRLRDALAALSAQRNRGTPEALLQATEAFYEVIFDAAGHAIAWEIVQRLNSRISRLRALTLSRSDRAVPGQAHMERICAAICAHDPDAAARAVNDHLRDAAEIAHRALVATAAT